MMKQYLHQNLKKILIGLAIVILVVGIGLVLKKYNRDQATLTSYTSPDGSFSTDIPKSWTAQNPQKGAIVATFVTNSINTTSNSKPYINIAKGAINGDLPSVYSETLKKYQKLFRKVQILQESSIKIGGDAGKKLIFDGTLGGRLVRYTVVLVSHNGVVYTLTASSATSDFEQVNAVVDKMITEWKFLQ